MNTLTLTLTIPTQFKLFMLNTTSGERNEVSFPASFNYHDCLASANRLNKTSDVYGFTYYVELI